MENKNEIINRILADWNPIGVPEDIANEEYQGYVSVILKSSIDNTTLMSCLEDILINKMGIDFDPKNEAHLNDLRRICNKIIYLSK